MIRGGPRSPPFGKQVVFQPQNVMTMARAGQPLSEVASQADVFIRSLGALENVASWWFGVKGI